MYQNACGAAAASAGGCVETDKDCHSLIPKESIVPTIEHDYSGFDIVKATQVIFSTSIQTQFFYPLRFSSTVHLFVSRN